jgi:hypothetical protein
MATVAQAKTAYLLLLFLTFSTAQNIITSSKLMGLLVTFVFKNIRKKGLSQINWKTP